MAFRTGLLALCLAVLAGCADNRPDAIFFGGVIYTGEEGLQTVEAVAVRRSRIVYAGPADDILKDTKPETELIDLKGAVMYPGFIDAHAHLAGVGARELTFNLEGTASIVELVTRVEAELTDTGEGEVLFGRGWIETHWPEARFPTRDDLDAVSGDNPVILIRADGHALVANSQALDAAGIDVDTPDPSGGRIERDETGRATGMLIDAAMSLVNLDQELSPEQVKEQLQAGGEVYARRGWTNMHNMSAPPQHVRLMEELSVDGKLPIRVYNFLTPEGFESLVLYGPGVSPGALIETRAVKIYMDGALGSRGAALNEPYSDQPDTSGLMLRGEDETLEMFEEALKRDVQLAVHAIGDKANTLALDWMEKALEDKYPGADPRWRIEHAQILSPNDISRFAKLGVIASMQPSHAIGDLHFAPDRLGEARLSGAYAWRSLLDAGAVIAAGSDAPVEVGDPLIEFYAAVARKDLSGYAGDNWHSEQAVSREEALKMMTYWPAYASFREDDLGTIEVGKYADFTVLNGDLMTVLDSEILGLKPVMTVVGGAVVWSDANAQN